MKRPGRGGSRGFTLIEVLVSVAIFGLAAALAYGGLSGLARTRGELQQASERLQALQFAVGLIERDLRAAVDRPVRAAYEPKDVPALLARGGRLELSRIGRGNELAAVRADIERVGYQLDGSSLQRLSYQVLDRTPSTTPEVLPLLDGVESLQFRVFDSSGRELAEWPRPLEELAPALPRAVEVRLRLADGGGEIRRLLELPELQPQPSVASP